MVAMILLVLKASIILSVFAIGLKSTFEDTIYLFRRPAQLVRAVFSMNVLMPVLALILALAFDFHPALKIALVAIAVSPVPPIFPNRAFRAGGTETYTIGLLTAAAVLAVILIPIWMKIAGQIWGLPLSMRARSLFGAVLTTVLLPLLIGIAVRTLFPAFSERIAKPMALISFVLLIVSALPVAIGMAGTIWSLVGDGTVIVLSLFACFGLLVGHLLGNGPEPGNRHTLAIATATRHPAVALSVALTNFPNQKLAVPVVMMYLVLAGIWSTVYMIWAKRQEAAQAAHPNQAVKA